jgi:hypothetical protein
MHAFALDHKRNARSGYYVCTACAAVPCTSLTLRWHAADNGAAGDGAAAAATCLSATGIHVQAFNFSLLLLVLLLLLQASTALLNAPTELLPLVGYGGKSAYSHDAGMCLWIIVGLVAILLCHFSSSKCRCWLRQVGLQP